MQDPRPAPSLLSQLHVSPNSNPAARHATYQLSVKDTQASDKATTYGLSSIAAEVVN